MQVSDTVLDKDRHRHRHNDIDTHSHTSVISTLRSSTLSVAYPPARSTSTQAAASSLHVTVDKPVAASVAASVSVDSDSQSPHTSTIAAPLSTQHNHSWLSLSQSGTTSLHPDPSLPAMNTYNAGHTPPTTSRSPSPGEHSDDNNINNHHTRQESGYQSSTIGTNSIPPMTIGVKRGSDLLASRRGPQITGQNSGIGGITRAGSAPPSHSHSIHIPPGLGAPNPNQSLGNLSVHDIFDPRRMSDFDVAVSMGKVASQRPVYATTQVNRNSTHPGQRHDSHSHGNSEDNDDDVDDDYGDEEEIEEEEEDGSEDDGIEVAHDYIDEKDSQIDNYGMRLPMDADPAYNNNNNNHFNRSQSRQSRQSQQQIRNERTSQQQQQQQPFYQVQRDHVEEGNKSPLSAGTSSAGNILSSEALAARMLYGLETHQIEPPFRGASPSGVLPQSTQTAHNEALRQAHLAATTAALHRSAGGGDTNTSLALPQMKQVASGTLGSPFNEQQQQQQHGDGIGAIGNQSVPIVKQPVPKKNGHNKGRTSSSSINKKQSFPNKVDNSVNSSNITLNAVNKAPRQESTRKISGNGNAKKPPVSNARYNNGSAERGRKMSNASEKSVKKDDLLDRLADALKAERKLVKLYQDELKSAEKEMNKILEAEAARDEETARLEARHIRDKQLISALKLKIERLGLELIRAQDIPHHEAESYLDLLGGGGSASNTINKKKQGQHKGDQKVNKRDSTLENGGYTDLGTDTEENASDLEEEEESDEDRSMRDLVAEQDALDGTWTKQMMEKENKRRTEFAKKKKQYFDSMAAVNASDDEQTEARLAEAQAKALAQAGLDQRPPLLQSHTRKLSFKDTLKRTFGLKPLVDQPQRIDITRVNTAPTVSIVPASSNASPPGPAITAAVMNAPAGGRSMLTSAEMARTVSSPPTMSLPPIPIDPSINAKDAKAQHRRLQKLASENPTLKPTMPDGTFGRSASMDVPRTPFYTPASMSETALPQTQLASNRSSGYASDSETGTKSGVGLAGLFKRDKPPPANNTRYGAGIEGGKKDNISRTRKLSWGRSASGGGNNSNTGGGGSGFFKHLFPGIDAGSPLSNNSRIQAGHPAVSSSPARDRWKKPNNNNVKREEKTWSQQLPRETTVLHG